MNPDLTAFIQILSVRFAQAGLTIILQTTVLILAGLIVMQAFKKKSATLQSMILRVCLVTVLMSPVTFIFFKMTDLTYFTISLLRSMPCIIPDKTISKPLLLTTSALEIPKEKYQDASYYAPIYDIKSITHDFIPNQPCNNILIDFRATSNSSSIDHDSIFYKVMDFINRQLLQHRNEISIVYTMILPIVFSISWLSMSAYFLVKTIVSYRNIAKIRRMAKPSLPECEDLCKIAAEKIGISAPTVLQDSFIQSVHVAGVLHPVIFVPSDPWNQHMITMEVFTHELAHLKRHDNIWNMLCQAGKIMIPVQPLLRIVIREIRKTNDFACDDYVVCSGFNRYGYANQLYQMALNFNESISYDSSHVIGFLTHSSSLPARIRRIIDMSNAAMTVVKSNAILSICALFFCIAICTGFISIEGNASLMQSNSSSRITDTVASNDTVPFNSDYRSIQNNRDISTALRTTGVLGNRQIHCAQYDIFDREVGIEKNTVDLIENEEKQHVDIEPSRILFENRIDMKSADTIIGAMIFNSPSRESGLYHVSCSMTNEPSYGKLTYDSGIESLSVDPLFDGESDETVINTGGITYGIDNSDTHELVFTPIVSLDRNFSSVYPVDTAARNVLYANVSDKQFGPIWSPDGNLIAFTDSEYGIWTVPVEGGDPVLVFNNYNRVSWNGFKFHSLCDMDTFGFSPDGKSILFQYYIIDEKRGSVVSSFYNYSDNSYSFSVENLIPTILKVDIDTGKVETVIEEAEKGCFSHDGRYLAYLYYDRQLQENHTKNLVVFDTLSKSSRFLTHGDYTVRSFCFTQDNQYLIASLNTPGNIQYTNLYYIPIDGGEPEKLTSSSHFGLHDDLHCTPDGQWIVYADNSSYQKSIGRYNMTTGKEYITSLPGTVYNSSLSPDGSHVCCVIEEKSGDVPSYRLYRSKLSIIQDKTTDAEAVSLPFSLTGNFPNPFNSSTMIEFRLEEGDNVSLVIYNISGQKVRSLLSESFSPGKHSVVWDGCDDNGRKVSTGVYIGRLVSGKFEATRKMMVMK